MLADLQPFTHSIAVLNVCGDAEAYVFDVDVLSPAQRDDLVATHLRAFADNLVRQKKKPWEIFAPVALLGTSMPAVCHGVVDLSAPHEGCLLVKKSTGGLFYVAAADDYRGFFVADAVDALALRPSSAKLPADPVDFKATPTTVSGFTLAQYAIVNPLAQVIGKRTGLLGVIERLLASS